MRSTRILSCFSLLLLTNSALALDIECPTASQIKKAQMVSAHKGADGWTWAAHSAPIQANSANWEVVVIYYSSGNNERKVVEETQEILLTYNIFNSGTTGHSCHYLGQNGRDMTEVYAHPIS